VSPASRDESVSSTSVRHILIQAETTDEEGNSLAADVIEKNFADAKAEAEKLMQTWKDNGATEEAFIALIADNTDDTPSIETDGLYDDVKAGGNYVAEFTNWAIDPARKPGDTGLVKTEFGYHFMYFVEASSDAAWESEVRSTLASNDYNTLVNGVYDDVEEKLQSNDTFLKFFADRLQKTISTRY
ncbi:MAG: peptidylprolyl isomerase, partial [Clostridia bacterium]|nr:peptidylprolyl isomerase [Clostridia bacterium]